MRYFQGCGTLLLLVCVAGLGCIQAVTLEVREGNSTCIKAEVSAFFSITYNASSGARSVQVPLPNTTRVDAISSTCGTGGGLPGLVATFGPGHALGLSFSRNGSFYSVDNLTLQYNLSDTSIFPDANSSDVVTVVSASVGIRAAINTTYRCVSATSVAVGAQVVTLSDMRLQAYMPGDDLSPAETTCAADQASTVAPITTQTPSTPPPEPSTPEQGVYSVRNLNGTVCFLAQMGLQLNFSYVSQSQNKTIQEIFNLTPNLTSSSGSCEASRATLVLVQDRTTTLGFTFSVNSTSNKFYLSAINLSADWPDMTVPVSAGSTDLDYLRTTLGRSYKCNMEQSLPVQPGFSLNTFRLQVQAFNVTTNQFATAEECQMDQDQMLIPIIVGAALAGLVLIVLVAYLIGRKRSHAGYQTI
ncbi:lysosome-associated membrane glycoprotein 1a isoform X2 [Nerophis lumbriciformis]|uniref:lysosome-associated membrane glycoprotein 1a isoform X2 n=1 Tax=Nerophis lumbriciformis TaxID=546530 RepID=UPI003BAC7E17